VAPFSEPPHTLNILLQEINEIVSDEYHRRIHDTPSSVLTHLPHLSFRLRSVHENSTGNKEGVAGIRSIHVHPHFDPFQTPSLGPQLFPVARAVMNQVGMAQAQEEQRTEERRRHSQAALMHDHRCYDQDPEELHRRFPAK
jgi:hypothetical protein